MLRINETFFSVQGEGCLAGRMMQFIRLFGCNLDCSWCDQPNALETRNSQLWVESSPEEVAQLITPHPITVPVCFTGGEPAFQANDLVDTVDLVRSVDAANHPNYAPARLITMESNGTIFIPYLVEDPCFFLSCSPKFLPVRHNGLLRVHGEGDLAQWVEGLTNLCSPDELFRDSMQLKFVVEDLTWFEDIVRWVTDFIPEKEIRGCIPLIFQPEWYQRAKFAEVLKKVRDIEYYRQLEDLGFQSLRFMPQSHKILHIQ